MYVELIGVQLSSSKNIKVCVGKMLGGVLKCVHLFDFLNSYISILVCGGAYDETYSSFTKFKVLRNNIEHCI